RLLHGGRGQGGEADDVAGGVDVLDRRLVPLVDGDQAALVDAEPGALYGELSDVGHATGRHQPLVHDQAVAALQLEADSVGLGNVAADALLQAQVDPQETHLEGGVVGA